MVGIMKSKRLRDYSQGALNAALISHRELGMSLYNAAKFNSIPSQTVRRYVKNPDKEKMGHGTKFSDAEEQTIAQILIHFAETNLLLSKAHPEMEEAFKNPHSAKESGRRSEQNIIVCDSFQEILRDF